ncbi:MAG: 2-oxoacid:acceptor oxidoreductase subunit alpha [Acidimicrobiales bacterium]|nr:2-oxoacid:acceptor oxidoreductase subunit alpha [Acidimicrobiales bacterium]RZV45067.1 MAG: 2-oxoacid:acceptor oxidoreductase subunit alpha [Acidimicrobiales bacterium]
MGVTAFEEKQLMTDIAEPQVGGEVEKVVIRFAGDSGDGMQLTGDRFTSASALFGNEFSTLPEFPAEIRAPAGTLAGVSAFQVQISSEEISTPGDEPTVLVAMNPAALKSDLSRLAAAGTLIVNEDAFEERNLEKAGYLENPLEDGSLTGFTVIPVPMTRLTREVCEPLGVKPRVAERSKNFFALGLVSWMYTRPTEPTIEWINQKFSGQEAVIAANTAAFNAGHAFGETAELGSLVVSIRPAELDPGTYTNINGNTALSWGLIAASQLSGLPLFLGSYPITPASDILHELSKRNEFGIRTFQAEDEIAAVSSAIGAAYGGHLAVTTTSGPGVALKGEAIGLAVSLELPLIVVDVQRGGPSTGLPTKTEASDLMMALYGRHGESPMPVVSAHSPSQCFDAAIEAARIALTYKTPVMLLTDGYLANSSEPWKLPDVDALEPITVEFATETNQVNEDGEGVFWPYIRDEKLTRPWAVPGTDGLMHRIGGLEKADGSGNVSYDPGNHGRMTDLRQQRIELIAEDMPLTSVDDPDGAKLALVTWGSTWGAVRSAVRRAREDGLSAAHVHVTHLHPFHRDLGEVLARYDRVVVPELNMGQLVKLLRAEFLVDAQSVNKVMGQPFTAAEIEDIIRRELAELEG